MTPVVSLLSELIDRDQGRVYHWVVLAELIAMNAEPTTPDADQLTANTAFVAIDKGALNGCGGGGCILPNFKAGGDGIPYTPLPHFCLRPG